MEKNTTAKSPRKVNVSTIAGLGILTALVVVLQLLASVIRFGAFSITLALVPIIVGAALFGKRAGTWLGLVFGVTVLLTPGACEPFMTLNPPGTILVVALKGAAAGFFAALVYGLLEKKNSIIAVIAAGVASPVANTGIFLLGCLVFFYGTISEWAAGAGLGDNVGLYMITAFVGLNFVVELATNLVLSSAIVAIIKIGRKTLKKQ